MEGELRGKRRGGVGIFQGRTVPRIWFRGDSMFFEVARAMTWLTTSNRLVHSWLGNIMHYGVVGL